MMARIGLFLLKYWKIIALVAMVGGAIYTIHNLYEDNKLLSGQVELAEDKFERCKTVRDDLSDRLDQLTLDLQKVEGAREQLEDMVEESEDRINTIRSERDRLLWEIENREVPIECEAKFDWMIERFEHTRRQFYEEGDSE